MKNRLLILFLSLTNFTYTQNYNIQGNIQLESESDFSNITITLSRYAPSLLNYQIYSDNYGFFSTTIEEGIYNITYEKNGFIPLTLTDVYVYQNIVLTDTILQRIGISGNLNGILENGIYNFDDDVFVPYGDTLIIEPGAKLHFRHNVKFIVNGTLLANGSINDTIIFTQANSQFLWGGIQLSENSNSELSYCIIEKSGNGGITINNNYSSSIHHSTIKSNQNTASNGGGICINYGNAILNNLRIYNNSSSIGGGLFIYVENENFSLSNCIIYNNFATSDCGGIAFSSMGSYNPNITNNNIINNTNGGIRVLYNSATFVNNLISNNDTYGISFDYTPPSSTYIAYNNLFENSQNFINPPQNIGINVTTNENGVPCDAYHNSISNPMFEDINANNFNLSSLSPCIDVGINNYATLEFDFNNNIRIFDGNSDNNNRVDIGALEYNSVPLSSKNINNNQFIYPNPTKGIFNIETENFEYAEIYNSLGQMVLTSYEKQIDISNQEKGIYLLLIYSNNSFSTSRIVRY